MIGIEAYGGKIVERVEEGTDLFGYQYIKFAIASIKHQKILKWTLIITPDELYEGDEHHAVGRDFRNMSTL